MGSSREGPSYCVVWVGRYTYSYHNKNLRDKEESSEITHRLKYNLHDKIVDSRFQYLLVPEGWFNED